MIFQDLSYLNPSRICILHSASFLRNITQGLGNGGLARVP